MGVCGQGATNNSCLTAQTFCGANKQLVKDNSDIASTFSVQQGTKILNNTAESIKEILTNIYNYGDRGTKNPPIADINNLTNDYGTGIELNISFYNNIINLLKTGIDNINESNGTNISRSDSITKTLMDNLQIYISNYKLNPDRCDSCNTSCNANCDSCNSGQGCGDSCGSCEGCNSCDGCEDCNLCNCGNCTGCESGWH